MILCGKKVWRKQTADIPPYEVGSNLCSTTPTLTRYRFEGNLGEMAERWGTVGKGLSMHYKAILSKTNCLLVGCLTSQQQASVSQGRISEDNCTCCHTETEVADQTFDLTQSQYTDTGRTIPSADRRTPGAWHGSHWSANF